MKPYRDLWTSSYFAAKQSTDTPGATTAPAVGTPQ
jgi:hypothetical protein